MLTRARLGPTGPGLVYNGEALKAASRDIHAGPSSAVPGSLDLYQPTLPTLPSPMTILAVPGDERHADHQSDRLGLRLPRTAVRQYGNTGPDKRSDASGTEQCTVAGARTAGAQTRRTRVAGRADCAVSRRAVVKRADGIVLPAGDRACGTLGRPE